MSFFTGKAGPQRRVDLRGKSRHEETREEILERTRLEREKRQRAKLEQKSALTIQTRWRQRSTATKYANRLRQQWCEQYEGRQGGDTRIPQAQHLLSNPSCISVLLRFYDQSNAGDRARLAAVCKALSGAASAGSCELLREAAMAALGPHTTAQQTATPTEQQLALFRVSKLAALCLSTLATGSNEATAELSHPFSTLVPSQQPVAALLDFLIKIVNQDTWKSSIADKQQQQQAAQAGAAAVLRHLYSRQLYSHLRVLLHVVPAALPSKSAVEVLVTQLTVRCITLQLVPTQLSPKAAESSISSATGKAAAAAAADTLRQGVSQLLFVPNLWAKCASLAPVTGRLCSLSLTELGQQPSTSDLLAALPHSTCTAAFDRSASRSRHSMPAGASAAFAVAANSLKAWMDNILQAAAAGSLLKGTAEYSVACQTVNVLVLVLDASRQLAALQKQQHRRKRLQDSVAMRQVTAPAATGGQLRPAGGTAFVPGAGFMAPESQVTVVDDTDDDSSAEDDDVVMERTEVTVPETSAAAEAAGGAAAASAVKQPHKVVKQRAVAASAYAGEHAAAPQHSHSSSCLQLLAGSSNGTQLLRRLVTLLLPATTAEAAAQLAAAQQQPDTVAPGSAAQRQLCALLLQLSQPKQYRQRIWLGLSVGARLAPRLWFSFILPVHTATAGGLLASGSSSSSGSGSTAAAAIAGSSGWVQPLLVLIQCYSAALSFTHVEDFYADAAALVPLQQLYNAATPAAGLVMLLKAAVWQVLWCETSSQLQQQQLLKRAVGELGGMLLCQLHDRNCTRQYCPQDAFLAEALPPGRLLQEVAARGGIDALVGSGDSSEDDADHATPLEQQQQWQRQRQQAVSGVEAMDVDQPADVNGGPRTSRTLGGTSGHHHGGPGSESEDEDMTAVAASGDAIVISPGNGTVNRVGGFGFGVHGEVQQRRQQGGIGAAASSNSSSSAGSRVWLVLQHAPCLIPFQDRVQLFQAVVSAEKESAAASGDGANPFFFDDPLAMLAGGFQENRFVTIRRDNLLQDSFAQLNAMGPDRLKGRLRIAYVNEAGAAEAGIDGGGLFKDFMEELLKKGFSPQSHLFAENPQHQLYPNPAAYQLVLDAEGQLRFLGRMLGKSLYEGMLLELPLAAFFLKKMRGGVCDINDLPALDPEVYKNLLQLKHYKGDFADLSLNFTATVVDAAPAAGSSSSTPRVREVELKPNGRNIAVRADNVIEYIHRLSDFRLNRQMDRAAEAFLTGFFELIKPRWVRMFNEAELQMLISGSEEGIDVDDLVAHVNYAGGYHEEHPVILTLWETVRTFTPEQQRQFLKFVTSCSRAPLLGFAYLEPQLCIQMSGSVLTPDSRERLPTAATCMNLLKLPPYKSVHEMRSKLLYAITAGAGFELS